MENNKLIKYVIAITLIVFYAYMIFKSGIVAAMAVFLKVLGLVLFGMAHIWVVDSLQLLGKVNIQWRKLWSSISSLVYSRRSQ